MVRKQSSANPNGGSRCFSFRKDERQPVMAAMPTLTSTTIAHQPKTAM
jgi:hypothetical protein